MEAMGPKITLIGAGSARFAIEMMRDIVLTPAFRNAEVVLVDVDAVRLEAIHKVAVRYAREMGVSITFTAETDRRTALRGAKYVIATALAGGRGMMDRERAMLQELGYYRGIMLNTSHRQLALMLDIARDIADVCPEAWLLQCANPVPEGCTLAYRETGVKIVGICHGIHDSIRLAGVLGMDPGSLEVEAVGINHIIWATRMWYKGRQDAYPILDRWLQTVGEQYLGYVTPLLENADYPIAPVAFDLYRRFGLMPIGDTCRAISPGTWWYHTDHETKCRWYGPSGGFDGEGGHADNIGWLASLLGDIATAAEDPTISVTEKWQPHHSPWQVLPIMDSLETGRTSTHQVNIPNNGAISGLPDDFIVELPGRVDASGIRAAGQWTLPPTIMWGSIMPRWVLAEQIIGAFRSRDERLLMQVLLADHKTRTPEMAAAALECLMTASWNADMLEHYRGVGSAQNPALQEMEISA